MEITPTPTDDEAAAIAAALELCWPKPQPPAEDPVSTTPAWRFAGRWWSRPVPMRRSRPWVQA